MGIVGLAALLRLSFLGLIEFKGDEALTVLSLKQFWQQPQLIQAGLVSSTGARNFPLFQYLLIPMAGLSTDPRVISGFIGAVATIMIGWFFVASRREFGEKVGGIATLLLAVAPYPVLYSRKIWAQDLVWLLAIPIYILLLRIRRGEGEPWRLVVLGLLLMLQSQLHASGVFFLLMVGCYAVLKRVRWRWLGAGMIVGLIPALPYFWLQLRSRPPFPDWAAYQQMAGVIQNYPDIKHLFLPFSFMTNWGWSDIMGAVDYQQFVATTPAQGIGMLAGIVTALGLGYGLFRTIRDKAYRMLTGLLGGIVGLYFVMSVPARLHYYQVMAPYIAIIIAIGLIKLFRSQPLFLKPTIGFIVAANLLFTGMFWRYLSVNQGVMGDYGVPYKYALPRVMQSIQPYIYRKDIDAITTYAHFDPSLAKFSQGASIHAYLSKYFLMIDEPVLASAEAKLAEPLIK